MSQRSVEVAALRVRAPFATLFPIKPEDRARVLEDMREHGFDEAQPLDVWNDGDGLVVVDGHTRLACARELARPVVPVFEHVFADELEALTYSLQKQVARRNLTKKELVQAIMIVDAEHRKPKGGNRNPHGLNQYVERSEVKTSADVLTSSSSHRGASTEIVAAIVGISPATVDRARAIATDPEAMAALDQGMAIKPAADLAYANRRKRAAAERASAPELLPADQPGVREEPWRKAKEEGTVAVSIIIGAQRDIKENLAKLRADGIEIPRFMGDKRVSPGWHRALREARALVALVRGTIAAQGDGLNDEAAD